MNSPETRDRGLQRVRRLTIWLGGAAVVATGAFAGWFGRPQPSSASTTPVTDPGVQPSTTPSAGPSAGPSTSPSTTPAPPQYAPRPSRRRPGSSSGGS